MEKKTQNYGKKGGTLKHDPEAQELKNLALALSTDECKWAPVHAALYVATGLGELEHHANWGV